MLPNAKSNDALAQFNKQDYQQAQERLQEYSSKIFVKLPYNTQRAYKSDLNDFFTWCQRVNAFGLSPDLQNNKNVIEGYFDELMLSALSRATIERRLAVLATFLKIMEWPNPIKSSKLLSEHIRLSLNQRPAYQAQAEAMTIEMLDVINDELIPDCPLAIRDRLVVNLMFDGLLRSSELCGILLTHINRKHNTLFLPKSKTDQAGHGSYRYLSNTSIALIDEWINEFGVYDGFLLRALSPKKTIQNKPLTYKQVYRTFKRVADKLGSDNNLSTHSARIGAAVAMAENDIDILSIQRAGGWKSLTMPARYTEQASTKKAGMGQISTKFNR